MAKVNKFSQIFKKLKDKSKKYNKQMNLFWNSLKNQQTYLVK
jgi:hypothetical protein